MKPKVVIKTRAGKTSAYDFLCAGLAPSLSILVTSPIDVVKARMQTAGEGLKDRSVSTRSVMVDLIRKEGLSGCYRGIGASVLREASLNVMRLGLFDPIMSLMHNGYRDMASTSETGLPPLYKRLICGSLCGVIGSVAANPMELIKCRIQCSGEGATASHMYDYKGPLDAFQKILAEEGVRGLWQGAGVFALRNAAGSAANLSTFCALKAQALNHHDDSIQVDVACGLGSGFVTTCVMCPLDLIKTRLQNQPVDRLGRGTIYAGVGDAVSKITRTEGALAFYKGFNSLFVRTGPHYVLTFAIYGILKRFYRSEESPRPAQY
ncbi:hypothetical protein AAMO2058_000587800 [Amorphochlora amoebiformis]|uniref:Uncharacterized protein n=1 Tax=Amorphochlora amoebiformis TaxID=1561963 RepID=A0A7S0GQN3_9EUKA|mmetsp:Transcript_11744/g.18658  ORF Transcript_11744/g.18658 Transcript_11744/m.18658 type:complete len:321 (+) Transcript_11744:206-1168(+)